MKKPFLLTIVLVIPVAGLLACAPKHEVIVVDRDSEPPRRVHHTRYKGYGVDVDVRVDAEHREHDGDHDRDRDRHRDDDDKHEKKHDRDDRHEREHDDDDD